MKKIQSSCLTMVTVFLLLSLNNLATVKAQTPASHVFHVATFYMVPGMDSIARAERNATLKEYHDKVTMKNELILHSWSMQHYFSEDSREFVVIAEYANWNDIDKSGDRGIELEKKAWPDQKQRMAFLKKMNGYFTGHKDAIYNGFPALTK
jgi:hypothetical protein